MEKEKEEEKQMAAVLRTVMILEALSKAGAVNLETLSKITHLPKATLLRFLSTLSIQGYVYRDGADMYHLTLKMFSVGSRSLANMDIISTAKPFAEKLCRELGETVHMGILEDDMAIYILKEESKYTIRMWSSVGKAIPLYCTAIGKIFLSWMSDEDRNRYLDTHELKPFTPHSLKTREDLERNLEEIRRSGWAMDNEEHEENIKCIAAPVRDYTGAVVAAVSVSWPIFRFNENSIQYYASTIKAAADEISSILGYAEDGQHSFH